MDRSLARPNRPGRLACAAAALLFGVACAAKQPDLPRLPPVSPDPTAEIRPGKFVWGDLVTQDVEASKAFYGALFGWTFSDAGRYTTVFNRGVPIAGMVKARDPNRGTEWIGNLSVADVDRAAATIAQHGGQIESGPIDAPDRGRIALVSYEGNAAVLLVRASGGDPPDAHPAIGGWLWWELWARDVDRAAALLVEIAGYRPEAVELRGAPYRVLGDAKMRRMGIVQAPPEVRPTWLPYFRVADKAASVERAVALGARLVEQSERAAILVDPNRAEFAVGTWALETDRIRKEAP
ncbi:MAG: VOC family protein [Deltaproteobacteria bacterium]|jgi:predicted enzyme related to lactoylglutathione lyase|nr:VOC family protein [Deltaproteobacteria bacterium]